MNTEDLLKDRMLKFRKIGGFQEGIPVDPKRKVNMKKKDVPVAVKIPDAELEVEVEKLKQQILNANESSSKPPKLDLDEMIRKLEREVDQEYSEAVKALGLTDRFSKLQEEVSAANSDNQLSDPLLKDKIEKLKVEFEQGLSAAPNHGRLQNKLDMLKELSKVKHLSETKKQKQEVRKKFVEVINNPRIKENYEALTAEIQRVGASSSSDLDDELKNKIIEFNKEVDSQLVNALKSVGLDVQLVKAEGRDSKESEVSEYVPEIEELKKDIEKEIEISASSSDVKSKIEQLKLEVAKAGETPDPESKKRITSLMQQIKQGLVEAIDSSSIKEKYDNLVSKVSSKPEEVDGGLRNKDPAGDSSTTTNDELREKVGANRTIS